MVAGRAQAGLWTDRTQPRTRYRNGSAVNVQQASAGHHHTSGDAPAPASLRGRRVLFALVMLLTVATAVGMLLLRPPAGDAPPSPFSGVERVKGTVTTLEQLPCSASESSGAEFAEELEAAGYRPELDCTRLTVRIDEGPDAGTTYRTVTGDSSYRRVGQGVVLYRGTDPGLPPEARYQLTDIQRGVPLLALFAVFAMAILALGRLRGAMAVAGAGVSLVVLVTFLVPALLAGRPPLWTAVVGAMAVMIVVFVMAHGPTVRTATAMIGTAAALLLTVLLATVFVDLAGLSGVTSDEAAYVEATFGSVDLRGLLLAGIVVGALGILDDVTVTQVSTVYELRAADPRMPRRQLYAAGLRVGRDHIASTVNTLLLAYAGASMPLLVIFSTSGVGLTDTLTSGVVGEEIVRTLVGSIGLIAAVPITTALAAVTCPPALQSAEEVVEPDAGRDGGLPGNHRVSALPGGELPSGPHRFFDDAAWAARAGRGEADPDE
jgi:uncharacterized membrane protein